MLMNHMNANEIKAQKHEYANEIKDRKNEHNDLADKCNRLVDKHKNFHAEAMKQGNQLACCTNEVEDKHNNLD